MGTVLEVTVVAHDETRASRLAESCFALAEHWEHVLTTWRPDGELAILNAHAGKGALEIGVDLKYALERMLALREKTRAAFDPAVGSIVLALRNQQQGFALDQPVQALPDVLRLEHGTAEILGNGVLDAGAIGKGIALDAANEFLQREHADAWFLDFGGSSQLAHGRPPGRRSWIVGVAALDRRRAHGVLTLRDTALSTSRAAPTCEPAGAIVDPRSGKPVMPPRMATVLAPDATSADAWSTALIVLGRDGLDAARAAGLEVLYQDEAGTVLTPGFPLEH